jgi:glycosyltransferase involved in cell wall biosynthesis
MASVHVAVTTLRSELGRAQDLFAALSRLRPGWEASALVLDSEEAADDPRVLAPGELDLDPEMLAAEHGRLGALAIVRLGLLRSLVNGGPVIHLPAELDLDEGLLAALEDCGELAEPTLLTHDGRTDSIACAPGLAATGASEETLGRLTRLVRAGEEPELPALRVPGLDGGDDPDRLWPWAKLPDGTIVDRRLSALFRAGRREGGLRLSPFGDEGLREFYAWANEPDPGGSRLTRFLLAWRGDQLAAPEFPDLPRWRDDREFLDWAYHYGTTAGIPRALVPAAPPPGSVARGSIEAPAPPWARHDKPVGVNVAGMFQSRLGVGEAARQVVTGLDAAGVPVYPLQGSAVPGELDPSLMEVARSAEATAFDVTIACLNGDALVELAREVGRDFFTDRYTIGYWWWELEERFPDEWRPALELVDEIWVASKHVAGAFAGAGRPVTRVVLPVSPAAPGPGGRALLAVPGDETAFLCVYDYHSGFARKNPLAVVGAFLAAFPRPGEARLVLKSRNAGSDPARRERLIEAVAAHPHIHVLDADLTAAQGAALLAAADCVVSLHRAEGFALPLAEAMALGTPVIATAYGGNLEFMTAETAGLVPAERVEVGFGGDPYPADAHWAEPDVEDAARQMRALVDDPHVARLRTARARAHIAAAHSPAVAGASMRERLAELERDGTIGAHAGFPASSALAAARERIAEGAPAPGKPARRPVWDGVRKLMSPQIVHQQTVDEELAAAIDRVLQDQAALQSELLRLRRAAARVTPEAADAAAHLPPHVAVATDLGELLWPLDSALAAELAETGRDAAVKGLLADAVEAGDTVVVAGARAGYSALAAAALAGPSGRVVALEPAPGSAALLRANLERAGAGLTAIERALAPATGPARLPRRRGREERVVPALAGERLAGEWDRLDVLLIEAPDRDGVLAGFGGALERFGTRVFELRR